jgi:hypothetical protein
MDILDKGELLSSKQTGYAKYGQGYKEYTSNTFVYLSATNALFDPSIYGSVTLFMDDAVLQSRKFSTANYHNYETPDIPNERICEDAIRQPHIQYRRVYPQHFDARDAVLAELSRESKAQFPPNGYGFQALNQVAVKDRLIVRGKIRGIRFNQEMVHHNPEWFDDVFNYMYNKHPKIAICVSPDPDRKWEDSIYSFYKPGSRRL